MFDWSYLRIGTRPDIGTSLSSMERTKHLAITISVILLAHPVLKLGIHAALISNTAIPTGMLVTPPEILLPLIYIYFQFQIQQPHHYR
jgi:hypothetical protein